MSMRTPDSHLVDDHSDSMSDSPKSHGSSTPGFDPSHGNSPLLSDMLKTLSSPDGATLSDTNAASKALNKSAGRHNAADASAEGSELTIQTLYEGPSKCKCCINWVEEYPDDLRMDIEQQNQTKQKALVVRMRKNHSEGKSLTLDSVLIQSQSLKSTLARVFDGYQGITPNLKKLVFRAPFHPFYYRWENFTQVLNDQKANDTSASSYTQLLYDVLDAELRDVRGEIADLLGNGVITYELLWSLFEPGERVIAKIGVHWQFFVTKDSGLNKDGIFQVQGKYIDWDGSEFGYADATMQVCPFAGTRPVTELEVYPARFHTAIEDAESKVIARGKRFRDLRGFHHMAYSGTVQYRDSWGRNVACNVSVYWSQFLSHSNNTVSRPTGASSWTLRRITMPAQTRGTTSWPLTPQQSYPISASKIENIRGMNILVTDVALEW